MTPKISIGTWAFAFGPFANDPWPNSKILKFAAESGYDGVELNGFRPHPHPDDYHTLGQRKALQQEFASYGLGISGYAPDFTAVPPAVVDPSQYVEMLKKYIAFAQDLGTNTIRVDTVSPPTELSEAEYENQFSRLVATWRSSAELAQREGMKIVWEFEPGFWLNKPSEVKKLVQTVDHPSFKVLFDTSHAYMSGVVGARHSGEKELLPGGVVEYAQLLDGYIGHFHLIDSDGTLHDEETSTHAEFGHGKVDFPAVFSALKETIFGLEWWCIDFCFNAEVERWAKEAIPFIREKASEVL